MILSLSAGRTCPQRILLDMSLVAPLLRKMKLAIKPKKQQTKYLESPARCPTWTRIRSTVDVKEIEKEYEKECKDAALSTFEKLQDRLRPYMYSTKLFYDTPSLRACAKVSHAIDPSKSKEYKDYFNGLSVPNQVFIPGRAGNKVFVYCNRCFKLPKDKKSSGRPNESFGMECVTLRQVAEIEMIWTLPGQWEESDKDYNVYLFGDKLPEDASKEDQNHAKQLKVRCNFIVHHLWPHDYGCCLESHDLDCSLDECSYATWDDVTHRDIPSISSYGYGINNFCFEGIFGNLFKTLNEQLHLQYSNPLETILPGRRISFGQDHLYSYDDRTYLPLPTSEINNWISPEHQVAAVGRFLLYFINKFNLTFMFGTNYPLRNYPPFPEPMKDGIFPIFTAHASIIYGGNNVDKTPSGIRKYQSDKQSYVEIQNNRPIVHQPWHADFQNVNIVSNTTDSEEEFTIPGNPKIPEEQQGSFLVMVPIHDYREILMQNFKNKWVIDRGQYISWCGSFKHAGVTSKYVCGGPTHLHPAIHINVEHQCHKLSYDGPDLLLQYEYSPNDYTIPQHLEIYPKDYTDELLAEKLKSLNIIAEEEYIKQIACSRNDGKHTGNRKKIIKFLKKLNEMFPLPAENTSKSRANNSTSKNRNSIQTRGKTKKRARMDNNNEGDQSDEDDK
jgi:hypothetical protein